MSDLTDLLASTTDPQLKELIERLIEIQEIRDRHIATLAALDKKMSDILERIGKQPELKIIEYLQKASWEPNRSFRLTCGRISSRRLRKSFPLSRKNCRLFES